MWVNSLRTMPRTTYRHFMHQWSPQCPECFPPADGSIKEGSASVFGGGQMVGFDFLSKDVKPNSKKQPYLRAITVRESRSPRSSSPASLRTLSSSSSSSHFLPLTPFSRSFPLSFLSPALCSGLRGDGEVWLCSCCLFFWGLCIFWCVNTDVCVCVCAIREKSVVLCGGVFLLYRCGLCGYSSHDSSLHACLYMCL